MEVVESFNISGRGVGVFLNQDQFFSPPSPFKVKVTLPNGEEIICEASKGYARKVPPGEIEALVIKGENSSSIPVGSTVKII